MSINSFFDMLIKYAGKLIGRYYNNGGNPTRLLKGVEAKAARGTQLKKKKKRKLENEEAKIPSCDPRRSQEDGGQV
jgi:hypothetical protein